MAAIISYERGDGGGETERIKAHNPPLGSMSNTPARHFYKLNKFQVLILYKLASVLPKHFVVPSAPDAAKCRRPKRD